MNSNSDLTIKIYNLKFYSSSNKLKNFLLVFFVAKKKAENFFAHLKNISKIDWAIHQL